MAVQPPEIEAFPPMPQRKNKDTFANLFDDVISWFSRSVSKVGQACLSAYQNAVGAEASASAAAASAEAAIYTSGATQWISGTTYAKGAVVWSPSDGRSYRRLVGGGGTVDPGGAVPDSVNWETLSRVPIQLIRVQGRNTSEYNGGTITTRVLNTVLGNTIPGASVSNNQITLPAGTYEAFGFGNGVGNSYVCALINSDDNVSVAMGQVASGSASMFSGYFTITSAKRFAVTINMSTASSFGGSGLATDVRIMKVN